MNNCDCVTWEITNDKDCAFVMLFGFHPDCQKHELRECLSVHPLMVELLKGIDQWAAEEDGVPELIWDAYLDKSTDKEGLTVEVGAIITNEMARLERLHDSIEYYVLHSTKYTSGVYERQSRTNSIFSVIYTRGYHYHNEDGILRSMIEEYRFTCCGAQLFVMEYDYEHHIPTFSILCKSETMLALVKGFIAKITTEYEEYLQQKIDAYEAYRKAAQARQLEQEVEAATLMQSLFEEATNGKS